jgi:hypothetical protein
MPLEPDGDQLETFIEGMFRHCGARGSVSLRAFYEFDSKKPFRITNVGLAGGLKFLMSAAIDDARRAAQDPKPVVFCPPIAVFDAGIKGRAREEDILEAPALSVELDQKPYAALADLERLIGPATLVVRSGGKWTDPASGEAQDRLHAHWRLVRPARGASIKTLKRARRLATALVGGDPSNVPACHPIRWPGGWHRKAAPRLCEIIDLGHLDDEIDLDQALAKLESAVKTPESGAAQAAAKDGPLDWELAFGRILSGEEYHPTLAPLAASFAYAGLQEPLADYILDCLLKNSRPPDSERLRRRDAELAKLPETVRSAYAKFASDNQQAPGGQAEQALGLDVWDAGDVAAPPRPRAWLLGTVFCRTFLSSLIAEGGAGKTAVRYPQYLSLTTGRELTGEHVFQRCRVLIVSLEDDAEELDRRIFAARLHYGINAEDVKEWLFLAAPGASAGKLMTLDRKGRPVRDTLAPSLEAVIISRAVDLVALDPFVKAHGVTENDNKMIDEVAQILTDLAAKHNIAVDIPHHVSKGASDPGNANRGRGASAAKDAARLVYTLTAMTAEEAGAFGVPEEERRSFVRMDSAKVNIAPPMATARWFRLVGVPLGNATELYPNGDEVQTVEPWSRPQTWEGLDAGPLNRILDAIDAGLADDERYSDDNHAKDRAAWKILQRHAPTKTDVQCREIVKQWLKNGVLVREPYDSKNSRKKGLIGLFVVNAKRPGTRSDA